MKSTRRVYNWIGLTVSVLVAMILPIVYFAVSYSYLKSAIETEADVNASIISGVINANPDLWRYEKMRLEELLSQRSGTTQNETRRILDKNHALVAESAHKLTSPVISRSYDLQDAGVVVGSIEISRSLFPTLLITGIIALIGISFGATIYFLLWKLAFNRIILAEQQRRNFIDKIIESSPHAVMVLDLVGTITRTNLICTEISGQKEEELVGQQFTRLFTASDTPSVETHLREVTSATTAMAKFAAKIIQRNGTVLDIAFGISPFAPEGQVVNLLVTGKDITERIKAQQDLKLYAEELSQQIIENQKKEESLHASEQKFRAVFDQNFHLAGMLDLNGKITDINSTALKLIGADPSDLLYKDFRDTPWWSHSPELQEQLRQAIRDAANGTYVNFEATHLDEDGNIHFIDFSLRPIIDETGTVLFLVPEGRDITERKKAEEERLSLERQLLHSQKLESLGILSGGIAHDFNNLLQAILGNLDIAIKRLPEDSVVVQKIINAINASNQAAKLTNMMLAYSGKGNFVIKKMSLTELVQKNATMLSAAISKSVTLDLQLDDNLPLNTADEGQVQQIVMNLITNASEAIGEENGSITLSTGVTYFDQTTLNGSRLEEKLTPGNYVWIESSDTGCGMDEHTLQKLFDPFFTTKFTGRGLGMSAVLGIIRAHKGALLVKSTPAVGTSIKVLFPLAELTEENMFTSDNVRDLSKTVGSPSGTILVVDDDEFVRDICADMLAEIGYETIMASSGKQAMSIFREQQDRIDLVVLDKSMPHMDGVAVFHELRNIRKDIKVVLASGFSDQEILERFNGLDLNGFIQKPFDMLSFGNEVQRVMEN